MDNMPDLDYKLFEQLFQENRRTLERIAYFNIGDEEEAKDIVGQSFLALWEHRADIRVEDVRNYLFVTVKNSCLSYRRRNNLHKKVYDDIQKKEGAAMEHYTCAIEKFNPSKVLESEIMNITRKTLMDMPAEQRSTFLKNRYDGLSYKDTAKFLGISYKKVDKNLQNVMKSLRKALKDYLK